MPIDLQTPPISQRELSDISIQWAMWADRTRFGQCLSDEDYELQCERLSEEVAQEIYQTLRDRDSR